MILRQANKSLLQNAPKARIGQVGRFAVVIFEHFSRFDSFLLSIIFPARLVVELVETHLLVPQTVLQILNQKGGWRKSSRLHR